jgi:hypothetical protein
MAQRSKITQLPDAVRKELEQRLIAAGFADYDGLADWLAEQGYEIHRSSVYRFGTRFEERVRALKASTDQARAIVEASPDDDGSMNEALMRLTQQTAFDLLMEMKVDPETIEFPKLVRAISDMNRSSVTLKKYQTEVRERVSQAAKAVGEIAKKRGMTKESAEELRREVLGIVST